MRALRRLGGTSNRSAPLTLILPDVAWFVVLGAGALYIAAKASKRSSVAVLVLAWVMLMLAVRIGLGI